MCGNWSDTQVDFELVYKPQEEKIQTGERQGNTQR